MRIEARGHLIDAGILGKALDTVTGGGGTYHVESFEIGTTTDEASHVVLEVSAADDATLEAIVENLGALGFSAPDERDIERALVEHAGVAPDGFYSTTNLPTRVRIDG